MFVKYTKQIEIVGLSDDENRYVNDWIRYTLQYAKDYNDSNEIGVMLDKSDWKQYDIVLGHEKSVSYNTEKMKDWLDVGNDNLIIIHNHPSNTIFSDRDKFLRNYSVKSLMKKHKSKRSEILQYTLESYQSKIKYKFRREDM